MRKDKQGTWPSSNLNPRTCRLGTEHEDTVSGFVNSQLVLMGQEQPNKNHREK